MRSGKAQAYGSCTAAAQQGIASNCGFLVLHPQWLSSIRTQHAGRHTKQVVCTAVLQHSCMCSAGYSKPALPLCAVHEHQGPLLEAGAQGRGARLQPEQHTVSPPLRPARSAPALHSPVIIAERMLLLVAPRYMARVQGGLREQHCHGIPPGRHAGCPRPCRAPGHRCGDAGKQPVPHQLRRAVVYAENLPQPDTQPTGGHTI